MKKFTHLKKQYVSTLIGIVLILLSILFLYYKQVNNPQSAQNQTNTSSSESDEDPEPQPEIELDRIIFSGHLIDKNTPHQTITVKKLDYDAQSNIQLNGYPEHFAFFWKSEPANTFSPSQIQLRVFNFENYKNIYPENVSQTFHIKSIQQLSFMMTEPNYFYKPLIPVIPFTDETPVYNAKVKELDFKTGRGIRFITQFKKNNQLSQFSYIYQGLTSNRTHTYQISFNHPLAIWDGTVIPPLENNPTDENLAEFVLNLNNISDKSFEPNLDLLDAFIGTLEFTPPADDNNKQDETQ